MPLILATNALTSLEGVKSFLDIPLEQTNDDEDITFLINASSSQIESYCKRKFKEQTYTDEEYDGNGLSGLYLRQYPVIEILSVSIDDVVLNATDYKCKKSIGKLIKKHGKWPSGEINIQASYTAGYTEIPADLELACKLLVRTYYKTDMASFSTTFQEGIVFRPEALPAKIKVLLDPFKKVD
jgi:hypothetical protein